MHHCVAYFDSGWKTVEDDSTDFRYEYAQQLGILCEIALRAEDGGREMAMQSMCCTEHLPGTTTVNQKGCRAEDFFRERRVGEEALSGSFEQNWLRREATIG